MTKQMKNCNDVKYSSISTTPTERNTVSKQSSIERWESIPFLDGYEISNLGRVKSSFFPNNKRGKILQPRIDKHGYLRIIIRKKGYFIHRLVAIAFIQNAENKPQINHIDGNKSNNNANNLEWCTIEENRQHAIINGLSKPIKDYGYLSPQREFKLNEIEVKEVREKYKNKKVNKCTYASLAKEYGVHKDTIGLIVRKSKKYGYDKR